MNSGTKDTTADRLAIMDVLCRYARGIDRCDLDTLLGVWWPGATADFGHGIGDAAEWSTATVAALRAMLRTQHMLGNMIIDIAGDRADSETYCRAYHEAETFDGPVEIVVGGRYLDVLEKRGGAWRILTRRYVMDWNTNTPSTARWDDGLYATLTRRGGRFPDDPLYNGA
ncbi:nuclear transport factor 2 family protein [Sphingosinicellaceae bacterium]|nr:nuclear transport factor 2 family protein [Sphingosinicellaceae bacterium]